tara:strand:- start:616 stop:1293 length:678 start_codon:yes stop_codon:yes gene_type:complete
MIYCIGDSWGKGEELDFDAGEKPFVHWVAKELGDNYINNSSGGGAFGIHCVKFFQNLHKFKKSDLILIIISPDIRWYDEEHGDFRTISMNKTEVKTAKRYWEMFGKRTKEWFIYHQSLFMFSIQEACKENGLKLLMMHNYGDLRIYKPFDLIINDDVILDRNKSLTYLLTEGADDYKKIQFNMKNDGPSREIFVGKYFEGNDLHPNELGHKKIADLILKKLGDTK